MVVKGYPVGIMIHPAPTNPHTITGYQYVGSGEARREVEAGAGVRE